MTTSKNCELLYIEQGFSLSPPHNMHSPFHEQLTSYILLWEGLSPVPGEAAQLICYLVITFIYRLIAEALWAVYKS